MERLAHRAASTKTDPREKRARQAFAAGRYTEALDLFATLYGDTVHPTYLRNIGRCYQNLEQPDKAINAFKDYLRLAKGLTVAEKREIDGYIAEMEAMKRQEASASPAPIPTASESPSQASTPLPTPSLAKAEPTPSAGTTLTQATQPTPSAPEEDPFYKKGWFWGVVGGVVVVGVVGALAASGAFSSSDQCSGRVCVNLGEMQ